jgi:hypothetical protein
LVFIRQPFSHDQQVGRMLVKRSAGGATTLDGTAIVPNGKTILLFTDVAGDTIYRLDSPPFGFELGVAYSASDTDGFVRALSLDHGVITPIVTGLGSARDMLFVQLDDDRRGGVENR